MFAIPIAGLPGRTPAAPLGRRCGQRCIAGRATEGVGQRTGVADRPARRSDARFADGLTVWEAVGQWRTPGSAIGHERSKVLLLMHGDTKAPGDAVQTVVARHRKAFDQRSVLWETARVCAAS
jgi:hypothetical protein